MLTCSCQTSNIEYVVAKDEASGVILLQAHCECCGKTASAFGRTVEQALARVQRNWKRKQ